ncbi:hypothetical protein EVJ20_12950 [Exiguobacterium sp. SH0S1]|uniref:hypothetical protein n=1 Tax=Exiguobacterium sp. SH0S1 TaxID=2510949 RepID=UPI00104077FD|nr:hypothetical protein [Exiguobacterium sp. SH0S1]TCI75881.1 hypothetical protein EVJ20_12950 [Exiguobacterium sp. SH0S1]
MELNTMFLIASLLLNAFLINVIAEQAKDVRALRRKQIQSDPLILDEALAAIVKEKIDTHGVVTAVKFLRETHDMSLLEAKRLVDRITGRSTS